MQTGVNSSYMPKKVSLLTAVKAEYDYEADISDGDVTNREAHFKIEIGIQGREKW